MNSTLLSTALVAALVGAASALAIQFATSPNAAPEAAKDAGRPRSEPAATGVESARGIAEQLRRLDMRQDELFARLEALERRPEPEARVALAPSSTESAASPESAVALAPQELEASVSAALESLRAAERAEAQAAREQRELERIEERLARLSERLELAPAQVGDLRALMLEQERGREELERLREQGVEREQRRAAAAELTARRDEQLARILTPAQLESYAKLEERRDDDRGRPQRGQESSGGRGRRSRG